MRTSRGGTRIVAVLSALAWAAIPATAQAQEGLPMVDFEPTKELSVFAADGQLPMLFYGEPTRSSLGMLTDFIPIDQPSGDEEMSQECRDAINRLTNQIRFQAQIMAILVEMQALGFYFGDLTNASLGTAIVVRHSPRFNEKWGVYIELLAEVNQDIARMAEEVAAACNGDSEG